MPAAAPPPSVPQSATGKGERLQRLASRRPARIRGVARSVQLSILILLGLAAWLVVFALGISRLEEQHDQQRNYTILRQELARATAPTGGAIDEGAPVALLQSAAAGFHDLVVVEGTTGGDLRSGPGHFPGTPLPGQPGTSQIFGRGVSYGAPFAAVTRLKPGEIIVVTTGQGVWHYVVRDVRYAGDALPPPVATGAGRLTLVTSVGTGWHSTWAANRVVYVDADLREKAQPGPPPKGQAVAPDAAMAIDTSGLYPLVLWLQLLVVAGVGVIWARTRWGALQTWIIGTPILIAALWGTTSTFWRLMPNLM
jgi:sortase A